MHFLLPAINDTLHKYCNFKQKTLYYEKIILRRHGKQYIVFIGGTEGEVKEIGWQLM